MSSILGNIRNNVIYSLNRHMNKLVTLQEQAATGSRINRISDAPSDAYRILNLKSQVNSFDDYINSLENTISIMGTSNNIVGNIMSDFFHTKTTLTQITSGIYNASQRQIIVEGLNSTLDSMVAFANTRYSDGQYLFSGTSTATAPYQAQYTNGKITSVAYQGSSEKRNVELAPGIEDSAFYVGKDLFGSDNRAGLSFIGADTGVAQGQGTSSLNGYGWLEISEPASGTYRLTVDGGKSYVDVAVPPGDNNTKVTNSLTGEILYLDTTGITGTGVELVNAEGTNDIFNTLITIRDIFANENNLPAAQIEKMRLATLDSIDEIYNILNRASVSMGSKVNFLNNTKDMLTDMKYDAEDETALIGDADITQVAMELSQTQILYQMSLSVAGRMMSMSLFDFV